MGKIRGPRIWPTGQALGAREGEFETEGSRAWRGYMKVPNAEAARAIVRQKKQDGYDGIKLSEFLTPDLVAVVTDEAHKLGMGVTGHSWDAIAYRPMPASTASSTSGRSATPRSWIWRSATSSRSIAPPGRSTPRRPARSTRPRTSTR